MKTGTCVRMLSVACLLIFTGTLGGAENDAPITHGTIVARVVGPNVPTPDTAIPTTETNSITNFWVTLKVVDVKENFATELKGKTIKLPTSAFSKTLLNQTLPLRLSHSRGRYPGSDYWLTCTSVEISRITANTTPTK